MVYALPDRADSVVLMLGENSTVQDALRASGVLERNPGADARRVGIFGRKVSLADRLADGDRIELYRPLAMDPKEARRRRARKAR